MLKVFIAGAYRFQGNVKQNLSLIVINIVIYFSSCMGGENYNYSDYMLLKTELFKPD
jgi:hypothetical protein